LAERYPAPALLAFGRALLERAGLPADKAAVVAEILLEADLLGHTTHGLQLLGPYLRELDQGQMTREGQPETVRDSGAALTWDGRYLPGPWLVCRAIDLALERLAEHPVVSLAIGRSHHIACLAAYLLRATERGKIIILMTSDPAAAGVAPFGGRTPVYTPNPIAAGWPTEGEPVLLDVSTSVTTVGLNMRLNKLGQKLPGQWLLDSRGRPSDDPAELFAEPPGTILPLGGLEAGHKGFALGLLVEALTSALAGFGRADGPKRWSASVFLQLIDPEAFGGADKFRRETGWLAEACRRAEPISPGAPVRLPGQAALARRRAALKDGVELAPMIMPALKEWAEKLGVGLPEAI